MQTVFSYSGSDVPEGRRSYTKHVHDEFYDGDLGLEPVEMLDIRVERALAYPVSWMHVTSNTGITYRRSMQHIRANRIGVRVIWIAQRGSLKLVRSNGSTVARSGECTILDSDRPFFAHAVPDEDGVFEAWQAIIPAYLFTSYMPGAINFEKAFPIATSDCQVIGKLLDLIVSEGEHFSRDAASPFIATILATLADNINKISNGSNLRRGIVDKRLADIEDCVRKNLTNPDLNSDEVAAKCGISPRYLCYVLKANGTSFSELLWNQRLPKARAWLCSKELSSYPIYEIAFMAGFKSTAHFSRTFKATYGCTPKDYRMSQLLESTSGDRGSASEAAVRRVSAGIH